VEAERERHLLARGEQLGRPERDWQIDQPLAASPDRFDLPWRLSRRWTTSVVEAPRTIIATFVASRPRAPEAVPNSPTPAATPR
jgi:hypothetical protein